MKFLIIFSIMGFGSSLFAQIPTHYSTRAISINERIFEEKDNILGMFCLNPIPTIIAERGDSVVYNVHVYFQGDSQQGLNVFYLKKPKTNWRQRIAKQSFYELVGFCCETDVGGAFEVVLPKKGGVLLIRDYNRHQDVFLHVEN